MFPIIVAFVLGVNVGIFMVALFPANREFGHFKTIMKEIASIIKMIFCKHDYVLIRKLYGDEINCHNGKRNEYRCCKCGMYKWE